MRFTFRLVGAITLVVGCILLGFSFYLLLYNYFYEEANNIYHLGIICIISSFIVNFGIAIFRIREKQYPKKVLSLFPIGFTLVLTGLVILLVSNIFWLFLLLGILGIVALFSIAYYEQSHHETFRT
jgi:hypothetical protein